MITSAHNPKIKLARALAGRPKERLEANAFLAEGVRLLEEALAANWPFRFVLYTNQLSERGSRLLGYVRNREIEADEVDARLLTSVSETENSQGIVAVLSMPEVDTVVPPKFTLVLDGIADPGNLGTLLRSANAAGVNLALLVSGTADAWAPKVVRAGMGAHFRLWFEEADWKSVALEDGPVYLADLGGKSCWETEFRKPLTLIVGSEAHGVSEEARRRATDIVSIPMVGKAESLNAAVAGSILMFEIMRQTGPGKGRHQT